MYACALKVSIWLSLVNFLQFSVCVMSCYSLLQSTFALWVIIFLQFCNRNSYYQMILYKLNYLFGRHDLKTVSRYGCVLYTHARMIYVLLIIIVEVEAKNVEDFLDIFQKHLIFLCLSLDKKIDLEMKTRINNYQIKTYVLTQHAKPSWSTFDQSIRNRTNLVINIMIKYREKRKIDFIIIWLVRKVTYIINNQIAIRKSS